jgi:toxin ParE1/3/4
MSTFSKSGSTSRKTAHPPQQIDFWITEKCQALAASPDIGQDRNDLAARLRSAPTGNYIIFYRSLEDGIQIIRVIHGARDIQELF